jgi:AraC-like DNA-binding protein
MRAQLWMHMNLGAARNTEQAGMTANSIPTRLARRPYGDELAENYGAEEAPFVTTSSLPQAEIGVTEINVIRPLGRPSTPLPRQDAYMIVHHFEDCIGLNYWEDGRSQRPGDVRADGTTIHDLRRQPIVLVDRPMHTLQWFVPRSALNLLADEGGAPCIEELRHDPTVGMMDDIIHHMALALLPALRRTEQVNRIFVDHATLAFVAHLVEAYGGVKMRPHLFKGGLAASQERRAKEMLRSDLAGKTELAAIAAACGLSTGHFARAFRRSTGLPPHAWLNKTRVDQALMLLRQRRQSLSEIALECGFADQSHFARVFARHIGLSPGAWRRMILG